MTMTRTESVGAAVVGPLLAAAGAGGGVVVAVTASRWFPIGSERFGQAWQLETWIGFGGASGRTLTR
jgi:hypothetical protein